jgi:hypothetical protein
VSSWTSMSSRSRKGQAKSKLRNWKTWLIKTFIYYLSWIIQFSKSENVNFSKNKK